MWIFGYSFRQAIVVANGCVTIPIWRWLECLAVWDKQQNGPNAHLLVVKEFHGECPIIMLSVWCAMRRDYALWKHAKLSAKSHPKWRQPMNKPISTIISAYDHVLINLERSFTFFAWYSALAERSMITTHLVWTNCKLNAEINLLDIHYSSF